MTQLDCVQQQVVRFSDERTLSRDCDNKVSSAIAAGEGVVGCDMASLRLLGRWKGDKHAAVDTKLEAE